MIWSVPRMWDGQTVYIIGGGHSLLKLDLSLIHDKRCIGVNNAYLLGNWVDILWFGDSRWLAWHSTYDKFKEGWKNYSGIRSSCISRIENHPNIKYVELSSKQIGIDTNPKRVCWNKTSGASAVNLAVHLGAKKIVLLGFDMQIVENKENWHNDHVTHGDRPNPYPRFLRPWRTMINDLNKLKIEIVNTTMNSAIPEEIVKRQEYLEVIKNG